MSHRPLWHLDRISAKARADVPRALVLSIDQVLGQLDASHRWLLRGRAGQGSEEGRALVVGGRRYHDR